MEFIGLFQAIVKESAIYSIKSENTQFQFGKENQQSRYGNCLGAWFQKAMETLAQKEQGREFQILFTIAPRSQKCLPAQADFQIYHQRMNDYIIGLYNKDSHIKKGSREL